MTEGETRINAWRAKYEVADNKTLGARVRAWRGEKQVSVAEAAEAFGMSKRTLEGIEQGRGFSYPKILLIAMKEIGINEFNFFDRKAAPDDTASDTGTGSQRTGHRRRHAGGDAQGG